MGDRADLIRFIDIVASYLWNKATKENTIVAYVSCLLDFNARIARQHLMKYFDCCICQRSFQSLGYHTLNAVYREVIKDSI